MSSYSHGAPLPLFKAWAQVTRRADPDLGAGLVTWHGAGEPKFIMRGLQVWLTKLRGDCSCARVDLAARPPRVAPQTRWLAPPVREHGPRN